MKFKKYDNFDNIPEIKYWIYLWDEKAQEQYYSDIYIIRYLGITINKFYKIIKKHNGHKCSIRGREYYFALIEDYNNCIEELEPYLIMENLIK